MLPTSHHLFSYLTPKFWVHNLYHIHGHNHCKFDFRHKNAFSLDIYPLRKVASVIIHIQENILQLWCREGDRRLGNIRKMLEDIQLNKEIKKKNKKGIYH